MENKSIQERQLDVEKQAVAEGTMDSQYLPDDGNDSLKIHWPTKVEGETVTDTIVTEETPVIEDAPLEAVSEEAPLEPAVEAEAPVAEAPVEEIRELDSQEDVVPAPVVETPAPVATQELPEDVDKLVKFMSETGGTLSDYVNLNRDYSELDEDTLLTEYYKNQNPDLDAEEINFLMEDDFGVDDEFTDEDSREYKRSQLKRKQTLKEAGKFFDAQKANYYTELKSPGRVAPENQEAVTFFNEYQAQQEAQKQVHTKFVDATNEVFSDDFKGFDFKTEGGTFKYKVNDVAATKQNQSDLNNIVGKFLDTDGSIKDASGYHKAMFAAGNVDKIANHFYQQGLSDAIKQREMATKNIDMSPKSTHAPVNKLQDGTRYIKDSSDTQGKINWPGKNKF